MNVVLFPVIGSILEYYFFLRTYTHYDDTIWRGFTANESLLAMQTVCQQISEEIKYDTDVYG